MARENFTGMTLNGDYRLQEVIGHGTSASVYLARDIHNSSLVAVKLFRPNVDPVDIRQEAKTQARLHHPNIVPFHWTDVAELPVENPTKLFIPRSEQLALPHPFIVMMHANQGSVQDRMRLHGAPPTDEAVDHLVQAAIGVQHAHNERVLHRDIKPANLLLHQFAGRDHLDVLVSDFGIAVKAHSGDYLFTRQVEIGTAPYVSPEQIKGKAVKASDQYSLGVVAYEMLTGRKPFLGESNGEYFEAHFTQTPPTFEEVLGQEMTSVLAALEATVMESLAKKPKDRHGSVGDFAEELSREHAKATVQDRKARTIIVPSKVTRTQDVPPTGYYTTRTQADDEPQTLPTTKELEAIDEPATSLVREQSTYRHVDFLRINSESEFLEYYKHVIGEIVFSEPQIFEHIKLRLFTKTARDETLPELSEDSFEASLLRIRTTEELADAEHDPAIAGLKVIARTGNEYDFILDPDHDPYSPVMVAIPNDKRIEINAQCRNLGMNDLATELEYPATLTVEDFLQTARKYAIYTVTTTGKPQFSVTSLSDLASNGMIDENGMLIGEDDTFEYFIRSMMTVAYGEFAVSTEGGYTLRNTPKIIISPHVQTRLKVPQLYIDALLDMRPLHSNTPQVNS